MSKLKTEDGSSAHAKRHSTMARPGLAEVVSDRASRVGRLAPGTVADIRHRLHFYERDSRRLSIEPWLFL